MRTGECVCVWAFERCAYMHPHARAHVYTSMRAFLEVYMQAHECLRQRMCLYVHNISLGRSPNHRGRWLVALAIAWSFCLQEHTFWKTE